MAPMFNDRIQPGAILYGYSEKNEANRFTKGIKYFKVLTRNGNKVEVAKLPVNLNEFDCKYPIEDKPKMDQVYTVTIKDKYIRIKCDNKNFPIKMWDGEPKHDI